MAEVTPVLVDNPLETRINLWKWENVNALDDCLPVVCGLYTEMTVQTTAGTKGSAGVSIEGSLDPEGSVYSPLTSYETGLVLDQGPGDINSILQQPYLIRPVVGAGSSGMTIILSGRVIAG